MIAVFSVRFAMCALDSLLAQRLNRVPDAILDDKFLSGHGLGNEISFYIFDYPPQYELEVREQLGVIEKAVKTRNPDLRILSVNLFDLVVKYLQEIKLWDRVLEMQRVKSNDAVRKPLEVALRAERITEFFAKKYNFEDYDVILLSGVGSVFPLLRSHSILNNLHAVIGLKPLVLFFPGKYTGESLRPFEIIAGEHYYRAFRFVL